MLAFVVLSIAVIGTHGRPEIPVGGGYNYRVPAGPAFPIPQPTVGGGPFIGDVGQDFGLGAIGGGAAIGGSGGGGGFGGFQSSLGGFQPSFAGGGQITLPQPVSGGCGPRFGPGPCGGISSGGGGNFLPGSGANFLPGGPTLVQKHIYVHVPPPEPEQFTGPRQVTFGGVPQKHYKIIFIKAPSAPSLTQQQINLAAQNQEKTIVYVLVKKPDDIVGGDLSLPNVPITPPSKPEVYFIKYKARKEITGTGGGIGPIDTSGIIGSNGGGSFTGPGGFVGGPGFGVGPSVGPAIGGGPGFGIDASVGPAIAVGPTVGPTSFPLPSIGTSVTGLPQYGPPGKSGPY